MKIEDWPAEELIETARLLLEPLRVDHADELCTALDDPGLHVYTGGRPATVSELRVRYERQVRGRSGDGAQAWLNWVLRHRPSGVAVGTVQATVTIEGGRTVAELAWVVAFAHQRQGYAREAATAMASWLRGHGAEIVRAHIHPAHRASMEVARHLGLAPTEVIVEAEVRWEG